MKKLSRAQSLELANLGPNLVLPPIPIIRRKLFNFVEPQLFFPCKMANKVQEFCAVNMNSNAHKIPGRFCLGLTRKPRATGEWITSTHLL